MAHRPTRHAHCQPVSRAANPPGLPDTGSNFSRSGLNEPPAFGRRLPDLSDVLYEKEILAVVRERWRAAMPIAPKPSSMKAHVAGSGIAAGVNVAVEA